MKLSHFNILTDMVDKKIINAHAWCVREGNVFSLSVNRGPVPGAWDWKGGPPTGCGTIPGTRQGDTPTGPGIRQAPIPNPTGPGTRQGDPPTAPGTPPPPPPHQNSVDGTVWAVHLWRSCWRSYLFKILIFSD